MWTDFTVTHTGDPSFFELYTQKPWFRTVKTQQEGGKYILKIHPELSTARPAIQRKLFDQNVMDWVFTKS